MVKSLVFFNQIKILKIQMKYAEKNLRIRRHWVCWNWKKERHLTKIRFRICLELKDQIETLFPIFLRISLENKSEIFNKNLKIVSSHGHRSNEICFKILSTECALISTVLQRCMCFSLPLEKMSEHFHWTHCTLDNL